jgi:anti-sigma-K factor RskA
VSDDMDLERVERMLQRTPAPEFVPAIAAAAARRAALGEPRAATRAARTWRWPAGWRMASAAAAFGAAVAVAVTLAIGGRGGGLATQYSLSLSGPNGATAQVALSPAKNGVRTMVVHINGLPPAGAGHYYQMWFRTGANENVSAVTFDTTASGRTAFKGVVSARMTWHTCWVTREAIRGESRPVTVLKA